MVSTLDLAKRIPVLSHLSEKQAVDLSPLWVKHQFSRGQVLARQGFVSSHVLFLLAGRAKAVRRDSRGQDVILSLMKAGDLVDEISAIDGEPNSASVIAESRTDVLALDKQNFMHCMYQNGSLAHALMKHMAQRVRGHERQIASLALLDVKGRLCRTLKDHAVQTDDGCWFVPDFFPRKDLAKMVGASREMVGRVLKEMEANGDLSVDSRRRITMRSKLIEEMSH